MDHTVRYNLYNVTRLWRGKKVGKGGGGVGGGRVSAWVGLGKRLPLAIQWVFQASTHLDRADILFKGQATSLPEATLKHIPRA